ncbi:hypothetical protein C8R45DRAFT_1204140 [Mycena sanguinolenta]|nr:hypothetical protein C8R45DRAFT_1204140 [Mycena sanguinolenta]
MYFRIFAVLGLALLLANASPSDKETNASRMKRGLPPLPPRLLMRNKASTTISAMPWYTQVSTTPSSRIQVFAANGSSLGYVKNSTPTLGVNLDADPRQDLRVRIVTGEPFSITFESRKFLSAPLQPGAFSPNDLRDLRESLSANKEHRVPGPHKDLARSVVWFIDSKTKELTALFSPGTKSPIFGFDAVGNKLHFMGNVGIYNSANEDSPVIPVKLYLSEDQ